ncbi:MAG: sodium:solute symporter family protein [Acidobacteriota bacterium]|jgi:solute:Na+ symporter, SSS family
MHFIDYAIIFGYLVIVLGIGVYFLRRQTSVDEYFVGDRKMGAGHIGFSVVATDVGGGFSIGLGGLGFAMGLSGSWLLFTGFIGAITAAVILIPRVKHMGDKFGFLTYPDFLEKRYDGKTRLLAALVSGIGYAGFVGAQILAGAKLSSAAFDIDLVTAVVIMAGVVILYTAFGGLQAVIYTDTLQWMVLLGGLLFFALPFAYFKVGGWRHIKEVLPPAHFSLTNISPVEFATWMFTIIPIWFVGMTLYQRIYATRDVKTAKRAWYLAGLLEWPLMSFLGVTLGMFARVIYPSVESEMGLPLLIKGVLPVGIVGLVMASYFSAIMSTADSCLLASVGNFVNDIYQKYISPEAPEKRVLAIGRLLTVLIGAASVSLALLVPKVLDAILLSYAFMVSGLFIPTLGALLYKRGSATAAFWSIVAGGGTSVLLSVFPEWNPLPDAILLALPASLVVYLVLSWFFPETRRLDALLS